MPAGGGAQRGVQNSFGRGHGSVAAHAPPVHARTIVSKQPAGAAHGPAWSLHTPACRRAQSLK